ncbi:MAG: hypothetical protein LBI69_00860 [Puniceicoccales bacterium]|nr:hypothetical protein [Puniceicoccales bacterium]
MQYTIGKEGQPMGHNFEQLHHTLAGGEIGGTLNSCAQFAAPCVLRKQADNGHVFNGEKEKIF